MKTTVVIAGLILTSIAPSHAQDANALLRKSLATYRNLNTYTHRVSATTQMRIGQRVTIRGNDAEVRYMKPNKLYVEVKNPSIGTIIAGSNGREQTIYLGNINKYQKRPAPPTAKAFVNSLMEFGVGTMLDPLFFLQGGSPETYFTGVTSKGTAKVFGVNCQVVAAQIKPGTLPGIKGGNAIYHIDPATGLVRKVQMTLQGQPTKAMAKSTKNGKVVSVPVTLTLTFKSVENIREAQLNPALNDASFAVAIPKGAQLQERDKPLTGRR
jgi:outer membrane lipoprotein-sorting protein